MFSPEFLIPFFIFFSMIATSFFLGQSLAKFLGLDSKKTNQSPPLKSDTPHRTRETPSVSAGPDLKQYLPAKNEVLPTIAGKDLAA